MALALKGVEAVKPKVNKKTGFRTATGLCFSSPVKNEIVKNEKGFIMPLSRQVVSLLEGLHGGINTFSTHSLRKQAI